MMDEDSQPDASRIFNLPPQYDCLDFYGGIPGGKKDFTLSKKIPSCMYHDFYEFVTELGKAMGYAKVEEDASTHIRRSVIEYYSRYQEKIDGP